MSSYVPIYRVSLVKDGLVKLEDRPRFQQPEDAARFFLTYYTQQHPGEMREVFVVATLNVRHKVTAVEVVSIGCMTSSLVHPREVFRLAVANSAAAIIVAHNHPSGDPEPSAEDLALTRRLASAGALLGIDLLDHVVVGDGRYVSLKARGVL